jgi:hypothetical protein
VPIVPALAAVANAVRHATGLRLTELPMSPPKVLAALDGGEVTANAAGQSRRAPFAVLFSCQEVARVLAILADDDVDQGVLALIEPRHLAGRIAAVHPAALQHLAGRGAGGRGQQHPVLHHRALRHHAADADQRSVADVQSWRVTLWPTCCRGRCRPLAAWSSGSSVLSWMFVRAPIEIAASPASKLLLYQMLEASAATRRPLTAAVLAMKTDG